jgi:RNA polymerase sigma factor (sigma-70 family)
MAAGASGELSDQQFVERFLGDRDPAVFEAIVRRHGPMVYRVCRGVLRQEQDAEDVFQATFLVLAQNLRAVRRQASLASWLHGVARRLALKARARAEAAGRRGPPPAVPSPSSLDDLTWREVRSALDAELVRLPQKWRLPLILCYFEGRTQDEAARQLGWSKTTLRRRLDEARAALGRRLARRGLGPAVLAAALLADAAGAAVPPAGLVAHTVAAAAGVAAGRAPADVAVAAVVSLARGAPATMFLTKVKSVAAALLLVAAVGAGAGALGGRPAAEGREGKAVAQGDGKAVGEAPQGREGPARPQRPAPPPDPPPELLRELAAFDAYRHGPEEKFAELERKADDLAKRFPAPDDRARIYYQVAHVAAQSDIRSHAQRVQTYARKCLALSRDPLQRGVAYSYLGSAAEVAAGKPFEERRRQAAAELLAGYAELLAYDLPAKAPELPVVEKLGGEGADQVPATPERARHAAQLAARQEAEFVRDLVSRRDTLADQLKWLYRPHPKIHGRGPEGPEELRALAGKVLKAPKAVDTLLAWVTAE